MFLPREIYAINYWVVDASGGFSQASGYPKTVDSKTLNNDQDRTYARAYKTYEEALAEAYDKYTRPRQVVEMMRMSDGRVIECKTVGIIALTVEVPDPEPEPDPDPESEPESE